MTNGRNEREGRNDQEGINEKEGMTKGRNDCERRKMIGDEELLTSCCSETYLVLKYLPCVIMILTSC